MKHNRCTPNLNDYIMVVMLPAVCRCCGLPLLLPTPQESLPTLLQAAPRPQLCAQQQQPAYQCDKSAQRVTSDIAHTSAVLQSTISSYRCMPPKKDPSKNMMLTCVAVKFSSICMYSARRSAANLAVSDTLAALSLSYSALAAPMDNSRQEMSFRKSSTRLTCTS